MATTNRIATRQLTTGQYAQSAVFSTAAQNILTVQFGAQQIGTTVSQARLCVMDADNGHKLATIVIDGTDIKTLEVQPAPINAQLEVECLAGSAWVVANQLTGGDQEAFPAGSFDATFCAAVFANGAIPVAKVAGAPLGIESAIADPGNGGNIAVTGSGHVNLNIAGGGHNRNLPDPTIDGQVMLISHTVGANAGTVTAANAIDPAGNTVLNFAAAVGQSILLVAHDVGAGTLRWKPVWQTPNSPPVYVPLIADPGAGGAIAVTMSGICYINIAAPAANRSLAAPLFEGQRITIVHNAGANAGTVTVTNGFCEAGATVLNFVSTATEQQAITLVGQTTAAGLRWRVEMDRNLTSVSRNVPAVANGAAVPVDRNDAIVHINAAGGGENRTLANSTYVGQILTIVHDAGANANTVTAANDIDPTGGHNVINFTAAVVAEMIVLVGSPGGQWRILANPNALVIN